VRLDDLDVICAVLDCTPADLLVPDRPAAAERAAPAAQAGPGPAIRPRRGGAPRPAPPV